MTRSPKQRYLQIFSNGRGRVCERERRRAFTEDKVRALRELLVDSEDRVRDKACVYATGSFGRGEASTHSDLDLFIVGRRNGRPGPDGKEGSQLKRLDEILIKADLIQAVRKLGIPEFSG